MTIRDDDTLAKTKQPAQQEPSVHAISGRTAYELWLETGRLRSELAELKAQQEPVAWRREHEGDVSDLCVWLYADEYEPKDDNPNWQPLYTSPPASKPWVGLEPQDFDGVIKSDAFEAGAYWANNILREKNAC